MNKVDFLCNDISFIFTAIYMFNAKKKNIVIHEQDISMVSLAIVELPVLDPLFMCEIQEFEDEGRKPSCVTQKLVSNFESLASIAESHKLKDAYLLSPGHLNKSEKWALHRLVQIRKAEYFHEGCSGYVYRYDLDNGSFILHDLNGLNKNQNELIFETILKLA
ncbi:hypothetical protein [Methylophilus sp.]|uniref:hypothetical protein n=1 Tax=Methylophilus sp. TaxID=29541 RepID=UPI0011D4C55E|nr:hypothetical protein [Methylophilus sp.]TXI45039.1 MAG: hypothetical protein E6Q52_07335 [Methylophilus sp.]